MKRANIGAWLVLVLASACRPQVGAPISAISGPAILAVKGEPAEVDPKVDSIMVHYEALAVDSSGRVPAANADISSPLLWSVCDQPKPPTESNSVNAACLDPVAMPGIVGDSPTTFSAAAPANACELFGPLPPQPAEGQPPIRPRDPDVTGGYYLPVRVGLLVPEDLRRVGMATEDSLIAFQLQRIYCGLANARGPDIHDYGANYKLNQNPVIASLTLQEPGCEPVIVPPLSASGAAFPVAAGQAVILTASWPADSVENYPALDVLQRKLVYHNEAMRVSWYATGGVVWTRHHWPERIRKRDVCGEHLDTWRSGPGPGSSVDRAARQPGRHGFRRLRFRRHALIWSSSVDGDLLREQFVTAQGLRV